MNTHLAPAPTAVDPWLRAGDADRQHVVDELQRHTADGRLTLDEFAARAEAAHRATTYGELAALTADLPATPQPVRPALTPTTIALAAAGAVVLALLTILLVLWLTGSGNGDMMDHMGPMMR